MTNSELDAVFTAAKAAGINCSIGGSLLHVRGNRFQLPVTTVTIETAGKGKGKVKFLQATLTDGQNCSLKQLCQVKGLGLEGNFQRRAEQLLLTCGEFIVTEVTKTPMQARDGKSYDSYAIEAEIVESE